MRKFIYLSHDLIIAGAAVFFAFYGHNSISSYPLDVKEAALLSITTIFVAFFVYVSMNTHKSIGRYTGKRDILCLIIAASIIVLCSNATLFLYDRLEGFPGSVPPFQFIFTVLGLCGTRLALRVILREPGKSSRNSSTIETRSILVVGVGPMSEVYTNTIEKIHSGSTFIEGYLTEQRENVGRMFHHKEIFGTPSMLGEVLALFNVQNIKIKDIIITVPFANLHQDSQQVLERWERSGTIRLVYFGEQVTSFGIMTLASTALDGEVSVEGDAPYQQIIPFIEPRGVYPYIKRILDVIGAIVIGLFLSPVYLLTYLLIALDLGSPVLFSQIRPGYKGRDFRIHKFRTMRKGTRSFDETRQLNKLKDVNRVTVLGRFIRRFRLDELPQIYHILIGEMSFVGPRPLLPEDQPANGQARLGVRPGITGLAQIHGGDSLNPEEKFHHDINYINNMSLGLDIKIVAMTILIAIRGDKNTAKKQTKFFASSYGNIVPSNSNQSNLHNASSSVVVNLKDKANDLPTGTGK